MKIDGKHMFENSLSICILHYNTKNGGVKANLCFDAKCWDQGNRADLIESATPCHDAEVMGPYRVSNPHSARLF